MYEWMQLLISSFLCVLWIRSGPNNMCFVGVDYS